jgi:hypothetical protein
MNRRFFLAVLASIAFTGTAHAQSARKTENVLIVTWDGYRWQEFFGGADEFLINSKGAGGQSDPEGLKQKYWRDTPEARREITTPFIWNTIAKKGQIFGDPTKNARAKVTNGKKFSYPGYNEIFCGFGDPLIDSNDKNNNANLSVLEFLNEKPAFNGKVAAICTWDVFPFILRSSQNGIPVHSGWTYLKGDSLGEHAKRVNEMVAYLPHYWPGNTFDLLSIEATRDYIPAHKPRVFFLGLGETDEWGHARRYDLYLDAAQNGDRFLEELWTSLQKDPQYKDKTTLILTTDHGRGKTPADWTSHGKDVEDAEYMWIAVMGPDTPALGVRENVETTQAQVAATIAAALGEDFIKASPQSARPLPVFGNE